MTCDVKVKCVIHVSPQSTGLRINVMNQGLVIQLYFNFKHGMLRYFENATNGSICLAGRYCHRCPHKGCRRTSWPCSSWGRGNPRRRWSSSLLALLFQLRHNSWKRRFWHGICCLSLQDILVMAIPWQVFTKLYTSYLLHLGGGLASQHWH